MIRDRVCVVFWNSFCRVSVRFLDEMCEGTHFRVNVTCVWEMWVYIYFVALVCIGLPVSLFPLLMSFFGNECMQF